MRRVKKLITNRWMPIFEIADQLDMTEAVVVDHLRRLDGYRTFKLESQYTRDNVKQFRVVPRA